ncbi:hypothetical protein LCGC14_0226010 [marine sediment metagenome]|uniref:HEAT repeat domain-containing protein n=1 Tax=marine sediment metagenome TaxID=412755 RepID=A0A0F9XFP2_9ZZZZ|nr:HEAT repeat domain-containing protein [Phycisphaerae bacterium]HDZ42946.1 HEAT repeat domain-containing protein [Phycisphaerae bacterium]
MRNVTKLVAVAMCMWAIGCAPAHMPSLWDVPPETSADAKKYISHLASWDPQSRAQACLAVRSLEGKDAEAAAPYVVALLTDETMAWRPSRWVRYSGNAVSLEAWRTVKALRKHMIPALVDALTSRSVALRREAASALGDIGGSAAEEALPTVLDDPDAEVRLRAAVALGPIPGSVAEEALRTVLDDRDAEIRARAAIALARMGDSSMFDRLLACLDSDNWRLRRDAIKALAAIGDPRAIDAISPITQDETPAVKEAAEKALESLRAE